MFLGLRIHDSTVGVISTEAAYKLQHHCNLANLKKHAAHEIDANHKISPFL